MRNMQPVRELVDWSPIKCTEVKVQEMDNSSEIPGQPQILSITLHTHLCDCVSCIISNNIFIISSIKLTFLSTSTFASVFTVVMSPLRQWDTMALDAVPSMELRQSYKENCVPALQSWSTEESDARDASPDHPAVNYLEVCMDSCKLREKNLRREKQQD